MSTETKKYTVTLELTILVDPAIYTTGTSVANLAASFIEDNIDINDEGDWDSDYDSYYLLAVEPTGSAVEMVSTVVDAGHGRCPTCGMALEANGSCSFCVARALRGRG